MISSLYMTNSSQNSRHLKRNEEEKAEEGLAAGRRASLVKSWVEGERETNLQGTREDPSDVEFSRV